ncbi:glycosyltransferase family 2 protein, partial [Crocinitomicaceae bacterium]|nr:glycosyltransferase family 2 protein [Crocinitomicaceae bacterium]
MNANIITSVIVTFNSIQWIEKVINSLRKSSLTTNIIIVDNGSKDGTIELIEKKHPKIQLVKSDENLGFSRANNLGIEIAMNNNAEFVFLLNHDAWVQDETLDELTKIALKHPEFGILSPLHLNGTGDKLDENFSYYAGPKFCPNLIDDFYLGNNLKEIYESKFVNAAAWLISKDCLEKVGGFNPIFHMYGEDDNYVNRLHFKGYKLGIVPNSKIYHDRQNRALHKVFIDEFLVYK